jgi:predicted Zn-dependent protease
LRARVGDIAKAESLLDSLKRELPSHTLLQKYWLPAVDADIALRRGDTTRAISRLEDARDVELADASPGPAMYPAYVRGLANLRAQQVAEAVKEFQNILDHRGLVGNHPLAVLARLGLARAYKVAGNTERARAEYEHVLRIWKNADDDLAALKETRAEAR